MKMLSEIDDTFHIFGTVSTVHVLRISLSFQTCNDAAGCQCIDVYSRLILIGKKIDQIISNK